MSDDVTPRLSLPVMAAGQAQKEVTVNEAMQRLDALVQCVAASAALTAPPGAPVIGTCWIVAPASTGAWAGQDGAIAQWTGGGWRFSSPQEGWQCAISDDDSVMTYRDGVWQRGAIRADGLYIRGEKVVGARMSDLVAPTGGATVDGEARAAIGNILSVLRSHGLIGS